MSLNKISSVLTIITHAIPFLSYFIFTSTSLYEQRSYTLISPYVRMVVIGIYGILYACSLLIYNHSDIKRKKQKAIIGFVVTVLIVLLYYAGYYFVPIISSSHLKDPFTMLLMLPGYWAAIIISNIQNDSNSNTRDEE